MSRWVLWGTIGLALVGGCEPGARGKSKTPRPNNSPNVLTGQAPPVPDAQPPAGLPAGAALAAQGPDPAAVPASLPVRLSNGIALAQTGPEGVLMTFHVDYQFSGQPPSGMMHVWILHRAKGPPAEVHVTLQAEGELEGFQNWRPEDGPFESWIEERPSEGQRREISSRLAMNEG